LLKLPDVYVELVSDRHGMDRWTPMRPLLVLIDLDACSLPAAQMDPPLGSVLERVHSLCAACGTLHVPIIHIRAHSSAFLPPAMTSPHEQSSPASGPQLQLAASKHSSSSGATTIHRPGSSAFSGGDLGRLVAESGVDTLLVAGIELHEAVRDTVAEGRGRGMEVIVVPDAVAGNDPFRWAVTRQYLDGRGVRFLTVDQLVRLLSGNGEPSGPFATRINRSIARGVVDAQALGELQEKSARMIAHRAPRSPDGALWSVACCGLPEVQQAAAAARRAARAWGETAATARANLLERWARCLEEEASLWAEQIAQEVGKPVTASRAEVNATAAMLRAVALRADSQADQRFGARTRGRRRPLGVVALITPWNNPIYISMGKIAPALLFGNTIVWKPAPAASALSIRLVTRINELGCPTGVINLICGDQETALALMSCDQIDAVSVTGSSEAGFAAQVACGRRRIPFQAELGGNNAAIVWSDADLADAARQIALGAFELAGQRCTANRRVIVDQHCAAQFLGLLLDSVAQLAWGDPLDPATQVGPLVSTEQAERVARLITRVRKDGISVTVPHGRMPEFARLSGISSYFPPTIVCCDGPEHEVVQEETFGPVLVVQQARDWAHSLELCNGVRQGLAAALFSGSADRQRDFLVHARAGIIKLNRSTAAADVDVPFGGWNSSGIGPPEHGDCDREFYTRMQTVYE
jgi:alpha-ketoglutaric semialdehyde dehydrogenase